MPLHQLFTEVLDVFGRPSRRFYEFLAKVATEESETAEIKHLLSKDGKADYLNLLKETVSYADLFAKFPSTITSIDYLA